MKKSLKALPFFALGMILTLSLQSATGRGGGGGGGARGTGARGFEDRGGFDRGSSGFDRGFDNRAGEYYDHNGTNDRRADDFNARANALADGGRDSASTSNRVSEQELKAGANHEYNFDKTTLPSDGAFAGISAAPTHTSRITASDLATHGNAVRQAYRDNDLFGRSWWNDHPNAWRYPYYRTPYWGWGCTSWSGLCGFWGMPMDTVLPAYDYGNNITYNDNEVYYGSQPASTEEQYYQEAQALAQTAPAVDDLNLAEATGTGPAKTIAQKPKSSNDWKPLGVFSLTQGQQKDSTILFQLAVNKAGTIRGNYENELTGDIKPVQGAIDKKSMRVAWTVGSDRKVVYDSGMSNLLQKQSNVLVHFDKNRTEQWTLVRLERSNKA